MRRRKGIEVIAGLIFSRCWHLVLSSNGLNVATTVPALKKKGLNVNAHYIFWGSPNINTQGSILLGNDGFSMRLTRLRTAYYQFPLLPSPCLTGLISYLSNSFWQPFLIFSSSLSFVNIWSAVQFNTTKTFLGATPGLLLSNFPNANFPYLLVHPSISNVRLTELQIWGKAVSFKLKSCT